MNPDLSQVVSLQTATGFHKGISTMRYMSVFTGCFSYIPTGNNNCFASI